MAKSINKKNAPPKGNNSNTKKKTLREIIETKIINYSKSSGSKFTSRVRLLKEIDLHFQNKTKNTLKYYLKNTLNKLLKEKILIRFKDSFRLSRVYLRKKERKALKSSKLKIKSTESKNFKKSVKKDKNSKVDSKSTANKKDSKSIKDPTKVSKVSKKMSQAITNLTNKIGNKLIKKPINVKTKTASIKPDNNANLTKTPLNFVYTATVIGSTTNNLNKNTKKAYQRVHNAIWQYYDNNKFTSNRSADDWYDYDPEASDIVEDAWQKYIVNRGLNDVRSVKSGDWEYMVDFMNWKQTNVVHSAHTQRNIRRMDENGKISENPYK